MMRILAHVGPRLPENKPHYLMGVGTPERQRLYAAPER